MDYWNRTRLLNFRRCTSVFGCQKQWKRTWLVVLFNEVLGITKNEENQESIGSRVYLVVHKYVNRNGTVGPVKDGTAAWFERQPIFNSKGVIEQPEDNTRHPKRQGRRGTWSYDVLQSTKGDLHPEGWLLTIHGSQRNYVIAFLK